jgi:hypothetical protein
MSNLIETAISHFSSKAVREIHIPEWDVTLYSKNLTLDDKAKWLARAENDTTDYLVYSVIFGVTDEKGEAVFDIGDKHKLRNHVDPEIVSRIATFVLNTDGANEEDREKN